MRLRPKFVLLWLFFAYECLIALAPFFENVIFFSIQLLLDFCQKSVEHICVGLILDSLFCFIDLWALILFFFFKIVLPILFPLLFRINFRIILSLQKIWLEILIGIMLNLCINLGEIDIFTLLHLLIPEYSKASYPCFVMFTPKYSFFLSNYKWYCF